MLSEEALHAGVLFWENGADFGLVLAEIPTVAARWLANSHTCGKTAVVFLQGQV